MQDRRSLTDTQINDTLTNSVLRTPLHWYILTGLFATITLLGVIAVGVLANRGLGMTGMNRPVMWGFFITNFVFWIGISHAGVMLSAILRLAQAEWRRPATRAAEVLTVFALGTAAMMPIVHLGRMWRFYWVFPYDWARGIWPDIRSPLVWDPHALSTYLIGSSLFIFVALIPDFAVLRDKTSGAAHQIYGALSMGFRGTVRQWRLQAIAGIILSALLLPVFVSVHSIVSWDFGMALAIPAWHTTIFAPYFVIGAVHSGVAGVITVLILLRWLFRWDDYIRREHIDALGRLLFVVANAWLFFFALEFMFGLVHREGTEVVVRDMWLFQTPWNVIFLLFLFTGYLIPVPMWLFRSVRRSFPLMLFTTILVNIGMWLERFLLIIPSMGRKHSFTFVWGDFAPSPIELIIVTATFSMVFMLMLLFAKAFPLIPIFDIKEGAVLRDEIKIGRRTVQAIIREE
mgnify:CR=1 FL=1